VNADEIRDLSDLRLLPVTTRRDLQDFSEENLRACGLRPGDLVVHLTSGSTGEPLRVWRSKNEEQLLAAFRLRSLLRFGVHPGERLASVQFLPEKARPVRKQHPFLRTLFPHVEIYCLLEIGDIMDRLNAFGPDVLAGLPPALDRICEEMERGGWPGIRPRRIVSGAELLTSVIRTRLVRQFGVPVFDRYSAVECRLIASSCPRHPELFHVCEDAVLIEVEKDGRPAGPG
jgi:phenylacetate-coenzyme A ligase PaaK-like adenylate-forming protein